jgi:hypothetical protein
VRILNGLMAVSSCRTLKVDRLELMETVINIRREQARVVRIAEDGPRDDPPLQGCFP